MKFPQGQGSAVIHRKKNRPALQRHDILTVSLVSFLLFFFFIGNLLNSSSAQFSVVLFYLAFYTGPLLFNDSVDFSYSKGSFFLFFSGLFRGSFSTALFLVFVLSSTHYVWLLCLMRMHTINLCVGDTWQRLWWDDFTHNGKQVVNRLKIPQGLSMLMFRRWSEVPSRGGVRGDSP